MFLNNEFYLMNKNEKIAKLSIEKTNFGRHMFVLKESYSSIRPYGFENAETWLERRKAPKHRKHIEELLKKCQCMDTEGYVRFTHALSLNDTFWVKPIESNLIWERVSLYRNEFDEIIAKLAFEGGLYGEQFSTTSPEFSTDGSFAKCWTRNGKDIYLMKAGSSGAMNAGLEPYSESLASQISRIICSSSVDYDLEMFQEKLCSKCMLFSSEEIGFVQTNKLLPRTATDEEIFQFYINIGAEDDFRRMLVLDALTINVDRHMGNYGVLINNETQEILGMAPMFDHNMSLLPYALKEDFNSIDTYLSDRPTKFGEDFNEVAHLMLTPKIKADLENLRGFEFSELNIGDFPKWRLKQLSRLVNKQIDNVLHQKRLYIRRVESSYEEQLEGWPDENLEDKQSVEILKSKTSDTTYKMKI